MGWSRFDQKGECLSLWRYLRLPCCSPRFASELGRSSLRTSCLYGKGCRIEESNADVLWCKFRENRGKNRLSQRWWILCTTSMGTFKFKRTNRGYLAKKTTSICWWFLFFSQQVALERLREQSRLPFYHLQRCRTWRTVPYRCSTLLVERWWTFFVYALQR